MSTAASQSVVEDSDAGACPQVDFVLTFRLHAHFLPLLMRLINTMSSAIFGNLIY